MNRIRSLPSKLKKNLIDLILIERLFPEFIFIFTVSHLIRKDPLYRFSDIIAQSKDLHS